MPKQNVKILYANNKVYISIDELQRILKDDLIEELQYTNRHSALDFIKDFISRISNIH